MPDPVSVQREYYARTAEAYDGMHDAVEHDRALGHIAGFARWLGSGSALDTGCGTGRALRTLSTAIPDLNVRGNDPSQELLEVATSRFGIPADQLDCASSEALPYADDEFDIVVATGLMHHVPEPSLVVSEMLRVARQAIFVSDCNMYGRGSPTASLLRRALSTVGLLRPVLRARHGGHDWIYTEGDGIGWNYSVYDSVAQVGQQCAEVIVIPTAPVNARAAANPRQRSSHALLCGFLAPLPLPLVSA